LTGNSRRFGGVARHRQHLLADCFAVSAVRHDLQVDTPAGRLFAEYIGDAAWRASLR
jgi:hypothetical protein